MMAKHKNANLIRIGHAEQKMIRKSAEICPSQNIGNAMEGLRMPLDLGRYTLKLAVKSG